MDDAAYATFQLKGANGDKIIAHINSSWVTRVRRDDLAGNFDLVLSISTAEEDHNKAQELSFMLQTMGNNMDPGMSRMILSDIARLRKMPDLAKRIESYEPQPDPMQQEIAQLQVQKLKAEIMEIQARTGTHAANAQLAGAKVGTEGAKAAHLKSDADLKNLDFVEQESGVKQERDKELHGEQARSQMQLKLLDRQFQREDSKMDLIKEYVKAKAKQKAA